MTSRSARRSSTRLGRDVPPRTSVVVVHLFQLFSTASSRALLVGCALGVATGGCAETTHRHRHLQRGRGSVAAAPNPPAESSKKTEERPFAASTAEATELISQAVDKKHAEVALCVREFRARKKDSQNRVTVSFGIDQEGRLLGVTSKGSADGELKSCIQDALRSAPFPRSHSGVITVTKSYEEIVD